MGRPIGIRGSSSRKESFENLTFRLPQDQSDRLDRFCARHRLTVGELFSFGLNIANVKPDGSDRLMIDYLVLKQKLKADGKGLLAHTARVYRGEAERISRFRVTNNVTLPQLLVYVLDAAGVSDSGDTLFWIDYETLTIRARG